MRKAGMDADVLWGERGGGGGREGSVAAGGARRCRAVCIHSNTLARLTVTCDLDFITSSGRVHSIIGRVKVAAGLLLAQSKPRFSVSLMKKHHCFIGRALGRETAHDLWQIGLDF